MVVSWYPWRRQEQVSFVKEVMSLFDFLNFRRKDNGFL
jgi:hypothetical protein